MSDPTFDITRYVQGWKRRMAEAQQLMAARKKQAFADARNIAQFLRVQYGCDRVVGIGSTFNEKKFTERSDIDLIVWGLPPGKYFSISSEIGDLPLLKSTLSRLKTPGHSSCNLPSRRE